jgi:hypothetical protein
MVNDSCLVSGKFGDVPSAERLQQRRGPFVSAGGFIASEKFAVNEKARRFFGSARSRANARTHHVFSGFALDVQVPAGYRAPL